MTTSTADNHTTLTKPPVIDTGTPATPTPHQTGHRLPSGKPDDHTNHRQPHHAHQDPGDRHGPAGQPHSHQTGHRPPTPGEPG